MLPLDIDLEVARDPGLTAGLRARAIGFGADEVDGHGDGDLPGDIGEEEEGPGGDADEDDGGGDGALEVGGDGGAELGDAARDLLFRPQHALDLGLGAHGGRGGGGGEEEGAIAWVPRVRVWRVYGN